MGNTLRIRWHTVMRGVPLVLSSSVSSLSVVGIPITPGSAWKHISGSGRSCELADALEFRLASAIACPTIP